MPSVSNRLESSLKLSRTPFRRRNHGDARQAHAADLRHRFWYYHQMYLMLIPGVVLLIVFRYIPIYGLVIGFKDYSFTRGILGSDWVGLYYFDRAFSDVFFLRALRNTFVISGLKLFVGFPIPILLALLLNEVYHQGIKRAFQTVTYFPYFISWVVLSGLFLRIFAPGGPVNYVRAMFGAENQLLFFAIPRYFLAIVVGTDIWRRMGYAAVIYLAALASIDPQLYEAANIDGAGRIRQSLHITIPSLLPVASILLILNMGFILNAGFDQIFNMFNPLVLDVGEIIDTYVYKKGIVEFNYSYGAAIGFFKSVVGLVLIFLTNKIAVVFGGRDSSLW